MNKISVTKRFTWCMAHRLVDGYEGKCANLHGHNYAMEVTVFMDGGMPVNKFGMVMDFKDLKELVNSGVNKLDHCAIVCERDEALLNYLSVDKQKHIKVDFNTTVENLSEWIAGEIHKKLVELGLNLGITLDRVRIWETEDSYATWEYGDS